MVADVKVDRILSLDLLQNNNCLIDIWCCRKLARRSWWTLIWRKISINENNSTDENLAGFTRDKEKKDGFAEPNYSISIVQEAPLYNQHFACCRKNLQNLMKITKSFLFWWYSKILVQNLLFLSNSWISVQTLRTYMFNCLNQFKFITIQNYQH